MQINYLQMPLGKSGCEEQSNRNSEENIFDGRWIMVWPNEEKRTQIQDLSGEDAVESPRQEPELEAEWRWELGLGRAAAAEPAAYSAGSHGGSSLGRLSLQLPPYLQPQLGQVCREGTDRASVPC